MEPSPLELTPEQKKQRDLQRIEAFDVDYQALIEKHSMELKPVIKASADGIIPILVHVNTKTQ